jgi:hypothetical protein
MILQGVGEVDTDSELMAHVAQLAEHVLGKDEVTRSIRVVGSIPCLTRPGALVDESWQPDKTLSVRKGVNHGEGEI